MATVTFDTNILIADPGLVEVARKAGCEIAVTSTVARELERSDISVIDFEMVLETGVWSESRWGQAGWGSDANAERLESILNIISPGFPPPSSRDHLSRRQQHLLRDAMILAAHVRERRDMFVTNDGDFVRPARRKALKVLLDTRIMTAEEFLEHCATLA